MASSDAGAGGGDGSGAGGGAGAAAGAAADGGGAGAGGGAAGAAAAFYESFQDADLKTHPSIVQNFKSPEDLAKAYVSLEKRFGVDPNRRIDLPADMNDKDGMRAVYAKLGLPEKVDGYGIQLAGEATDQDKAFLGEALQSFHELGLPAPMAKGVFEFWMGKVAAANEASAAADAEAIRGGQEALQKDFGSAFETRTKEIRNLITKEADPDLAKALEGDALFRHPNLAKFLGKLADRFAEPGAPGGGSGDAFTPGRPMTPTQATAALRALEGDPVKGKALTDASHPMHRAVIEERRGLLMMKDGRAPT